MTEPQSHRCNRREFLASATAASLATASSRQVQAQADRPNIIFLLTDDQRWDTLGCMGNPIIQTPNLDQLAESGCLFTNAFATTAICMASRASILTGLYKGTHEIDDFMKPMDDTLWAASYPPMLREAGYYTGFVGKIGLGGKVPEGPFDAFDGFPGQGQYFQEVDGITRHLTSMMGDSICRMVRQAPQERPFCLSVSFKAPHVQDQDPRQYLYDPALEDLYANDTIPEAPMSDPACFEALPDFIKNSECRVRWHKRFATPEAYQNSVKGYYRLISGVDVVVGRLMQTLEECGQAGNTVIVFTGDHGCYLGERGLAGKWLMHEESIRIPMLIHDPRHSSSARRVDSMALTIDVAPTILDLAGIEAPKTMQGRSLLPFVQGEMPESWRTEWFYEHHFGSSGGGVSIPASEGVRSDQWSYIRYVGSDPLFEELYDLEADPLETKNLALSEEYSDPLARFRERWRAWRDAVKPLPSLTGKWNDPPGGSL